MDISQSKHYRTLVLVLLTIVYTFNFVDRQIIGALSPFIQDDLGLTDGEMGWLKGFAFALLYTTVGLPIAWLADRYNRVKIIAISLAFWSSFTALTGLANSYATILLARIGVGIGEAGGSPPSHSIISDLYSKDERSGALGVYSLGIPFGLMFAFFAAGLFIHNLGWRGTLIALGVPGVLLALIILFVIKEPQRGRMDNTVNIKPASFGSSLSTLFKIPSWWAMCMGIAWVSFGGYAMALWGVDYMTRQDPTLKDPKNFKWLMNWLGVLNGVAYGIGTYFGARLAQAFAKKSPAAYGWVPAVALLIGVPCLIIGLWVSHIHTFLILFAIYLIASGVYLGPSFSIAQTLAPVEMRAMSTALFFFILNIIALGGGPTIIGIISEWLTPQYGSTHALRLALTSLIIPYCLSIIAFFWAAKTLPRDWEVAEARNRVDLT